MDLKEFGIKEPINIIGNYRILHFEKDAPIVFLIDEMHHNQNCINNNINNALELIQNANITLIGVESHSGGLKWDQYDQVYLEDELYKMEVVNTCPDFANGLLINHEEKIIGVECSDMLDKIYCNQIVMDNPHYGKPIPEHPLNKERSIHFIKTLFEKRNELGLQGNLILNCGSNHNLDIEELIINHKIDDIVDIKASYVRLNAF